MQRRDAQPEILSPKAREERRLRAPTYARAIVLALLIAMATVVALALFGGGGGDYTVTARFVNAGQIVKGNPVQAGGGADRLGDRRSS